MTTSETAAHRIDITVVVLAAGTSSRMGQHKLLLPLAGRPVIAWSVIAACASLARDVLIILGRDSTAVQDALPSGRYRELINTDFEHGQGTSLALAASSITQHVMGLLILLADQPFMDTDSIDRILIAAEREPDRIIMGSVNGQAGHPVYLPRRLFADLRALSGDVGAREIIARERDAILGVPFANELAHFDIDTSEDYQYAIDHAYKFDCAPD